MGGTHGNASDHHGHGPPPPPEPKTPMWLPALGAALFLIVALLWGFSSGSEDASRPSGSAGTAATAGGGAGH